VLATDTVNLGGIIIKKQTIGLATNESDQFASDVVDGLLGLGFNTLTTVSGVKTPVDNLISQKLIKQPIFSVFLNKQANGGPTGGEYIFGGIDHTRYKGSLTSIPVDSSGGFWQVQVDDVSLGKSLGISTAAIVDTGTTLIIVDDNTAQSIHGQVAGASLDPNNGWIVPCRLTGTPLSFILKGTPFSVPLSDLAFEPVDDSGQTCISGVQPGAPTEQVRAH